MMSLLTSVKSRFAERPDSEHQQAVVRFAVVGVFFVYVLWIEAVHGHEANLLHRASTIAALEFLGGGLLLAGIAFSPGKSVARRILGMLLDYSSLGVAMYFLGDFMSPLYAVYLWVTIGNGLRYGSKFLLAATSLATLSFLTVICLTPYWWANRTLAWGLLAGLVALPIYVSTLIRALREATEQSRRASEAKSRFLAIMSHELRTPLNGIVGMSDLLVTTPLNKEQIGYAQVIQTSAQTLLSLIENVLDISAIEAGKLKRQHVDFNLPELMRGVQLILQPVAIEKQLDFSVSIAGDVPASVHGDANHLRQILINLIANAIKFTERGRVAVTISVVSRKPNQCMLNFAVMDSGIGIAEEAKPRIFQAFEQADQGRDRKFDGSGLGTSIAKALTELAGGEIGFDSKLGQGSHFWARIPFGIALPESSAPAIAALAGSQNVIAFDDPFVRHRARVRPLNLLIADDQPANLFVLRSVLEKAGHKVFVANGGEDTLVELENNRFDAVVIDMHMPDVSGIDVLKQARFMQAGNARTPFVVLSADATPDMIRACEQAGARAFLTKPLATPLLLDTLADIALNANAAGPRRNEAKRPAGKKNESALSSEILDDLFEQYGGNFLALFIEECARDAHINFAALDRAGQSGDWDGFRDICHALIGVAGNVGAIELCALATDSMRLGTWDLQRDWRNRLAHMREQFELSRSALKRFAMTKSGQTKH
jgi:two-component system, sensor histidine kinase RpfC